MKKIYLTLLIVIIALSTTQCVKKGYFIPQEATVSGEFFLEDLNQGAGDLGRTPKLLCFLVDSPSPISYKYGSHITEWRFFCFNNQDEAKQMLEINDKDFGVDGLGNILGIGNGICRISGRATIIVSDFSLYLGTYRNAEYTNLATIKSVKAAEKPISEECPTEIS